ncbi:LamG domain-containing protein, partial [bacterium]|nr:LamG domain-containing protein [bacterium]
YQWFKNGVAIPDGGKISGATTENIVINGLSEAEEGFYRLAIFNEAGSVITSKAKLSMVSSGATMSDDLVVHLKFDETSGTTSSNSGSGKGTVTIYDDYGDPNEEPIGAEGLVGNGILINGAESETYAFGVLDNYPKINDNGTVSLWLNTPGIDGESAVVVRNGSAVSIVTENQFQITITNNLDGEPVLGCAISAGPNVMNIVDTEALALDEWVHVALTVDGGQLRLYKNGKLIGVADYLDRINGSTEDWLAIGANLTLVQEEGEDPYFAMDEANPQAFSGTLDDLALWHTSRSAEEIESIYAKGVAGSDATSATVTIPDFVEPGEVSGTEPTISLARNNDGTVTVTYNGTLQSAPSANGPWEDVAGATSPLTIEADAPVTFARSRN